MLTWRTGGLEAAIAGHAARNVVVFLLTTAVGDLDARRNAGDAGPFVAGVLIATDLLYLVAVLLLHRRHRSAADGGSPG